MSVTNGFLRLPREELANLRQDSVAFEHRCRDYDHPDFLDMDKAGYELLFILDPATIEYDNPNAETPFPAITSLLSKGEAIHEAVDLGYGPAMVVPNETLNAALKELEALSLDELTAMALGSELLPEVLMYELDAETIAEYHWPYVQALTQFLTEATQRNLTVLRY